MKYWFGILGLLIVSRVWSQGQACPDNISFSAGSLTHWLAYTGNNRTGNGPTAIKKVYSESSPAPGGTIGARIINEYNLPSVAGIQIINGAGIDPFGGFTTIPNINGYAYSNSVLLGSTAVSQGGTPSGGAPGGYIRGISYTINVPLSATNQPYTMTYAYAMVLENGTHNSLEQPVFTATLTTHDSVIQCASPKYYLPTSNTATAGGRGAILDTAAALAAGFKLSPRLSPTASPVGNGPGPVVHLQDVWTKGWTEVTFDLSAFRGQQVKLTFEADNCIPGGHFAYAYVAIRNNCAGLSISGESVACTNTKTLYSIPALAGARYTWTVPGDWTITSARDTNLIYVNVGNQSGYVIAREVNGCANLLDTIFVQTSPPTLAGALSGDTTVCEGINSNPLILTGIRGNVLKWISSTDGTNWTDISNTQNRLTATNLNQTTIFRAIVQNGQSCSADSSLPATVVVDPKSIGGQLGPLNTNICRGQDPSALLTLQGNRGRVLYWESSTDNVNWSNYPLAGSDSSYRVSGILNSSQYRIVVQSGVCRPDTSDPANIILFDAYYPQAAYEPADTTICYGGVATLNTNVLIGTEYAWSNLNALATTPSGQIASTPFPIQATATPLATTDYVLNLKNENCPNILSDTFHVQVMPKVIVDAGRDTAVVVNQPLQLQAISSDSGDSFVWSPSIGLSNAFIPNPVGIYDAEVGVVDYEVTATTAYGCQGKAGIQVKIFKTGPDIFVPNAFTPGGSSNRIFRPIPVGIANFQYFRIFNRWGQLVYSTSRAGDGWDGNINGRPQAGDSFVWMVQGIDYTGKTIFKKGVMTLIR